MQRLGIFSLVTLDGYIAGEGGDISWHSVNPEFQELAEAASNSGEHPPFRPSDLPTHGRLYWPSPEALKSDPIVAKGMHSSPKIVFSRTLRKAEWSNTRLVKDDMAGEVRKLKMRPGKGLTVLGSGSIVSQLAQEALIDEYQVLLNHVAIGKGKTMFEGLREKLSLRLIDTRSFGNGNVLLRYAAK
jgi:dihydrofolate reductase